MSKRVRPLTLAEARRAETRIAERLGEILAVKRAAGAICVPATFGGANGLLRGLFCAAPGVAGFYLVPRVRAGFGAAERSGLAAAAARGFATLTAATLAEAVETLELMRIFAAAPTAGDPAGGRWARAAKGAVDLLDDRTSAPPRLSRTRLRRAAAGGRKAILDSLGGAENKPRQEVDGAERQGAGASAASPACEARP